MVSSNEYGGISEKEIKEFAEDEGTPPTEAGASFETRFARNVSKLVSARIPKGETGEYSVFLLSETHIDPSQNSKLIEVPLIAHGEDHVSGCVWLSPFNLGTAFKVDLDWDDHASLFKAVRESDFGDTPALLVDWRGTKPVGRFYPHGLNEPEKSEPICFDDSPITTDEMKDALENFYQKSLRTPSKVREGRAVWGDSSKGTPVFHPEIAIQGRLLDALKARFSGRDMRAEMPNDDGRADITVHSKTQTPEGRTGIITEWVLELKALCDMTSKGNSIGSAGSVASAIATAISGGLEQAVAYRHQLSGEKAALCCYDMRKTDDGDKACFKHIEQEASELNVELWRWYLYRSTSASRKAKNYVSSCSK